MAVEAAPRFLVQMAPGVGQRMDRRAGETVDLASAAAGDRPVLVWFWAPH